MGYLDLIKSPKDLKKLNIEQLKELSIEIRKFLLNSISKTGGHLASNLGVVELTIALHYCFNCPKDKFIWDVGHQAYTHKILTGRKEMFDTLRKKDGLSGFPKTEESIYDAFNTGHSSTSISAAIGLASARDLNGDNYNVVSIIGDGSMTGGLVYEAMNNAGRNNTKLVIVLNDNQMSISKNVGAMSKYLSELRSAPKYIEVKNDVQKFLSTVPVVGTKVNNFLEKTKEGIKYALVPTVMFEQLGIKYIGPIDGHNMNKLINVLSKVKRINQPVLLHVLTTKGKGYLEAEKFPSKYHGVSKFDINTGKPYKKDNKETYSDVFGKTMVKMAARNKKIVAVTAAMPLGTGLEFFSKTYPSRTFDVGIAEEHAVTFSAGMAINGYIPVFAVYSTFLQRSYDQILHDVCMQNLHVIFAIDRAGIVGDDGETHQGIYDLSYLSHIPNMTIIAPKNKNEMISMINFAVKYNAPIAIRYPKGSVSELFCDLDNEILYGKSETIYDGEDIAVISLGNMIDTSYKVYKKLTEKGYSTALINARFVSPVDKDLVLSFKDKYKYIFTVEDNIFSGGFGSKIMQSMFEYNIFNKFIHVFSFPDTYVSQGTKEEIYSKYGLDEISIYNKIISIIENKGI